MSEYWQNRLTKLFENCNLYSYDYPCEEDIEAFPALFQYYPISTKAIGNFYNGDIYLSEPSKFNDPFDSFLMLSRDELLDGFLSNPVGILIAGAIHSMPNKEIILEAPYKNAALNHLANQGDEKAKNIVRQLDDFYEQLKDKGSEYRDYIGISCFSEKNDNALMWGHYADGGKGFCVCYDFNKKPELTPHIFPVCYSNAPYYSYQFVEIASQIGRHNMGNPFDENGSYIEIGDLPLIKSSIIKPEEWKYENEWRVIVSQRDIDRKFDKKRLINVSDCVEYIILGPRINDYDKNILKQFAERKNIPVRYAKMKKDSFYNAFLALRNEAQNNGLQDMTLDEINREITASRLEKEQFDAEVQKGFDDLKAGRVTSSKQVREELQQEFIIE